MFYSLVKIKDGIKINSGYCLYPSINKKDIRKKNCEYFLPNNINKN